jgi:hypothetical protein
MTSFTNAMAAFVRDISGNETLEDLSLQFRNLQKEMFKLASEEGLPSDHPKIQEYQAQLHGLNSQILAIIENQNKIGLSGEKTPDVGGADPVKNKAGAFFELEQRVKASMKVFDEASEVLDEVIEKQEDHASRVADIMDEMVTPTEEFLKKMKEARSLDLPTETLERYRDFLVDEMFPEIEGAAEETATAMSIAFDEAARSIQGALADFLFDPFADGLRGMFAQFVDFLRRMVAEITAAGIIDFFGGTSGIAKAIGGIFTGGGGTPSDSDTPGRASGGSVGMGQSVRVHEGEIATFGGAGGHVFSRAAVQAGFGGGGGGQAITFAPVTNIDARGADPGLIARLPAYMDQRDQKLMLKMKRYFETGYIPV